MSSSRSRVLEHKHKMIVIAAAMAGYAGAAAAYAYAEECAEDDDDDPEALQTALQLLDTQVRSLTDAVHKILGQYGHDDRTVSDTLYRALNLLQELDMDLDGTRMTALRDLFALDTEAAEMYLSIECEDAQKAWVQAKLREFGFPSEDTTILVPS